MTLDAVHSVQNHSPISASRLPRILVALHAIVMALAGIVWIRSAAERGVSMAGPEASFWYNVTRLESFPISYLARSLIELLVLRLPSSTPISASAALSIGYWILLLVLGGTQWYLVGNFVVWLRRPRNVHDDVSHARTGVSAPHKQATRTNRKDLVSLSSNRWYYDIVEIANPQADSSE